MSVLFIFSSVEVSDKVSDKSFSDNDLFFSLFLFMLAYFQKSIEREQCKADLKKQVIQNLLNYYENSDNFERWFPDCTKSKILFCKNSL